MLSRQTKVKAWCDLLRDDVDGEGNLDLAVETDRDLVGAERLERLDVELAPVEVDAGLGLHGFGNVGRRDRAEEPATLARAGGDLDTRRRQLAGHRLRPFLVPHV